MTGKLKHQQATAYVYHLHAGNKHEGELRPFDKNTC